MPAADRVQGDDAGEDDADGHQHALQGVDVGDGPQAAGHQVGEHDQGQQPHAEVLVDEAVGQHLEQVAGGAELDADVGNREQQRDQDGEEADGVAAEVVAQHLAGGDVAEALAQHPLALEEEDAAHGDGDRVERGIGVGEAVAEDQSGVAHEGPARERGGGRRQDEDPQAQPAAGDEEVADGPGLAGGAHSGQQAVSPIEADEDEQPGKLR